MASMIWWALGAGCLWHGLQIVWVAPTPSAFSAERRAAKEGVQKGSAQAFQMFWLDQYAWIGIALCLLGVVCLVIGFV